MGRWKLGPTGRYFDPNDEGPDQGSESDGYASDPTTQQQRQQTTQGGAQGFAPGEPSPGTYKPGGEDNSPYPVQPSQTTNSQSWDREKFRDEWMRSGASNMDALRAFLASNPYAAGVKIVNEKNGTVQLPTGEIMDLGIAYSTGKGQPGWTGVGDVRDPGGDWSRGSGSLGAGGASASGSSGKANLEGQTLDAIMRLLGRGEEPVTDASVMNQYGPLAGVQQRSAERARRAAAERMATTGEAVGGQGGALDAEVNAINQSLGESNAALMSQLVTGELQARRQQVVQALAFAQGEEKMKLEMLLAQMDNAIKQSSLALQGQQLNQQNQQFYDQMGYNTNRDQNMLDYYYAQLAAGRG